MIVLAVALGGALGALARWGVSEWTQGLTGLEYPWGTLVANLTGAFLIGLLYGASEGIDLAPALRALLGLGFLGAFTTFSTFSYEAVLLLQGGAPGRALAYVGLSVVSGVLLTLLGLGAGRGLVGI